MTAGIGHNSGACMVAFHVPGEPVAFARAGSKGGQRFTPPKQRAHMALIRLAADKAMAGQPPIEGPVVVKVRASFIVPKSWSAKRRAQALWHTSRPDSDNLYKIVADAMNSVVFADDAQVAWHEVQKMYGPLAGVTVSVMSLTTADAIAEREAA